MGASNIAMTHPDEGRTRWIDAAKGLGILLIVVGHIWSTVTPTLAYIYIYAFHVPLFFFVSGVTLRPGAGSLVSVVAKKVRTLLVPYLWYSLLGYLFYLAGYLLAQHRGIHIPQFDHGLWAPLMGILYGTIGEGRLVNGPLWFVVALFCVFCLGYVVNTYIRRPVWQWIAVGLLSAMGFGLAGEVALPFSGVPVLISLVFFQAGYRMPLDAWWQASSPLARWACLGALALVLAFSPINGFIQLGEGLVGHPLAFLLFAFCGLLATVVLLRQFDRHTRWLAWVGRYSLSIVLIHMLIIKAVKVVLTMLLQVRMEAIDSDPLLGLLVLGMTLVLLVPSVYVMERYLPFTLGKSSAVARQQLART
jgi:acyltransferase